MFVVFDPVREEDERVYDVRFRGIKGIKGC